ncbi:hypothetical protein [Amycolatopsis sp. GM8]|uniref:hypothetical protein n=1 Tax=Amycolatopsis sp. GM8 TaxID=2896530 RepID=UPI001F436B82|nr:hypothetical protein [Amycolatopsis sp. GM8]
MRIVVHNLHIAWIILGLCFAMLALGIPKSVHASPCSTLCSDGGAQPISAIVFVGPVGLLVFATGQLLSVHKSTACTRCVKLMCTSKVARWLQVRRRLVSAAYSIFAVGAVAAIILNSPQWFMPVVAGFLLVGAMETRATLRHQALESLQPNGGLASNATSTSSDVSTVALNMADTKSSESVQYEKTSN